jgi:hypothetical protein
MPKPNLFCRTYDWKEGIEAKDVAKMTEEARANGHDPNEFEFVQYNHTGCDDYVFALHPKSIRIADEEELFAAYFTPNVLHVQQDGTILVRAEKDENAPWRPASVAIEEQDAADAAE